MPQQTGSIGALCVGPIHHEKIRPAIMRKTNVRKSISIFMSLFRGGGMTREEWLIETTGKILNELEAQRQINLALLAFIEDGFPSAKILADRLREALKEE